MEPKPHINPTSRAIKQRTQERLPPALPATVVKALTLWPGALATPAFKAPAATTPTPSTPPLAAPPTAAATATAVLTRPVGPGVFADLRARPSRGLDAPRFGALGGRGGRGGGLLDRGFTLLIRVEGTVWV